MFVLNNTDYDSQFGGLTVRQEGAGQAPSRTKGTWLVGGGWEVGGVRMQVTGSSLHSLASDLGSPGPSFLFFKMGRMVFVKWCL